MIFKKAREAELPIGSSASLKINSAIFLSFSIATTVPHFLTSSSVSVPKPGPISKIKSSLLSSDALIISFKTFSSIKKFCPNLFRTFKSFSSSNFLISVLENIMVLMTV